jgi:hypothetical protein
MPSTPLYRWVVERAARGAPVPREILLGEEFDIIDLTAGGATSARQPSLEKVSEDYRATLGASMRSRRFQKWFVASRVDRHVEASAAGRLLDCTIRWA